MKSRMTPWGKSQYSKSYAPGVDFYSTASHGGFYVASAINQVIPEVFRRKDGWYEEDCEAMIVLYFLPGLSKQPKHDILEAGLRMWFPEALATWLGEVSK